MQIKFDGTNLKLDKAGQELIYRVRRASQIVTLPSDKQILRLQRGETA